MEEPPFLLDGARVVEFATLPTGAAGRFSLVINGVSIDPSSVSRLVIAENLVDGGSVLLHCNSRWETVAAGVHPALEAAERAARDGYGAHAVQWTRFRALTPDEQRELETTRSFLKELAADYPDE